MARNEKIQIDIVAKDEASEVVDDLAKKVDDLESDDVEVDVDADVAAAVAAFDEVKFAADVAKDAAEKLDAMKVDIEVEVDAKTDDLDTIKTKADNVEGSGRAASTAIGGLGNTVSELPGIGGLGAMAESMGQLAEGALEGEISVGELAATAGGLAVVGLAAKAITGHMEKMAAAKAFNADQVKEWSNALREGETLLGAINEELQTTGKLEFQGFTDVVDVVPLLAKAGLTIDDWTAAVEGNEQAQKDLLTVMRGSIGDGEAMVDVMFALGNATNNYNEAEIARANVLKVSSREQGKSTDAVVKAAQAAADHAAALGLAAGKTAELEAANKKLRGDLNNREAYLNIQQSFDDLALAGQQAMEDVAAGTVSAEEATRKFELQQIAAKEEVQAYIDRIGEIPPDKETQINALIDQGRFDEAEVMLEELTAPREMEIRFKFDTSKLNAALAAGTIRPPTPRTTGQRQMNPPP